MSCGLFIHTKSWFAHMTMLCTLQPWAHLGNFLVQFCLNGKKTSSPVPGCIQCIFALEGNLTLAVCKKNVLDCCKVMGGHSVRMLHPITPIPDSAIIPTAFMTSKIPRNQVLPLNSVVHNS